MSGWLFEIFFLTEQMCKRPSMSVMVSSSRTGASASNCCLPRTISDIAVIFRLVMLAKNTN